MSLERPVLKRLLKATPLCHPRRDDVGACVMLVERGLLLSLDRDALPPAPAAGRRAPPSFILLAKSAGSVARRARDTHTLYSHTHTSKCMNEYHIRTDTTQLHSRQPDPPVARGDPL
eukprot:3643546-Prymnesium_polylepis.1